MASQFLSSSEDEIRQLLEEKYSENTKTTYKAAQQVFHEYLAEKRDSRANEENRNCSGFKRVYAEA